MNLSISNIAWSSMHDEKVYEKMLELGFNGLEIAPTRVYSENPYSKIIEAEKWAVNLQHRYGIVVCSLQSIWYGRTEKIFGTEYERKSLITYTKRAIDFAEAVGARNVVFGCPRNRVINSDLDYNIAYEFYSEIAEYAFEHHTVLALEPNPIIYNTNFINTTEEAIALIKKIDKPGFQLNLDLGTVIYNEENIENFVESVKVINHVHISEPGLGLIKRRKLHKNLIEMLKKIKYQKFISIEMGNQDAVDDVVKVMRYVGGLCG